MTLDPTRSNSSAMTEPTTDPPGDLIAGPPADPARRVSDGVRDGVSDAERVLHEAAVLMAAAGLERPILLVQQPAAVLPTTFRVDVAAAAAVGALTAAVAQLAGRRQATRPKTATVNGRAAQISFRSERYLQIDGVAPADPWVALSGDYRSLDGWIRVHANFAHHAAAAARAMGLAPEAGQAVERKALAAALAARPSREAEAAILAAGGAAAAMRSWEEWVAHPHGAMERNGLPVRVEALETTSPARSWSTAAPSTPPTPPRGLEGLRVLDLTRIIAGPVCARVLSGHGADVLAVTGQHLPQIDSLVIDTGFGKRSCFLDLRDPADRVSFEALVAGADAVVESYRPGALAALGYSPQRLAELSPGLVIVDVRAYGSGGPWASRRGFDSLVQMVSGIAHAGQLAAAHDRPVPLPCQALDHATGWLAAVGLVGAWCRQRQQGGSWRVEVSLSATAAWFIGLGRVADLEVTDPGLAEVADLRLETPSGFGLIGHVGLPGTIEGATVGWDSPPPALGSSPPRW